MTRLITNGVAKARMPSAISSATRLPRKLPGRPRESREDCSWALRARAAASAPALAAFCACQEGGNPGLLMIGVPFRVCVVPGCFRRLQTLGAVARERVRGTTYSQHASSPLPGGPGSDLRAVGQAELGEDVLDVGFDGTFGDVHQCRDLLVGQALGDVPGNLCFPACKST